MWVQTPPEEEFVPKYRCSEKINLIILNVNIQEIWCLPTLPKSLEFNTFWEGMGVHPVTSLKKIAFASLSGLPANSGLKWDQFN